MRATLFSAVSALGLILATGCNKPPTLDGGTLAFVYPPDGGIVNGLPPNVVTDAGTIGITVKLQAMGVSVGSPVTVNLDGKALMDGGSVLTLPDGTATVPGLVYLSGTVGTETPHQLSALVIDSGGKGQASANSSVTVELPNPNPTIAIAQPIDGAILNAGNDVSIDPGFQVQVNVTSTAETSSVFVVCTSVQPTASSPSCASLGLPGFLVQDSAGGMHTITKGMASIYGATLADGDQTLVAGVTEVVTMAKGQSNPITIHVHTTRPEVTGVTFSPHFTDADGGVWLNSSNLVDGGASATAVVQLTILQYAGDAGTGTVSIVDLGTKLVVAGPSPVQFDGGSTPFASVPMVLPTDGPYNLEAQVTDPWGNSNFSPSLNNVGADVLLHVKTSLPQCRILGPSGYWNAKANGGATPPATNVSLTVQLGTTNALATNLNGTTIPGTGAVSVNTGPATSASLTGATIPVVVTAPQGLDVLSGSVNDPAGNPAASCQGSVTVATVLPTIVITPTNPTSVVAGVDTYSTGRTVDVLVTTTGAQDTQPISIFIDGGAFAGLWTVVGVVDGGVTATSLPGMPLGVTGLTGSVVDVAQNLGVTSSASIVDVEGPGCSVRFSNPDPTQVISQASGSDAGPSAVTVDFVVETLDGPPCDTEPLTFTLTPTTGAPVTLNGTLAAGKATFSVPLVDQESGVYRATLGDATADSTPNLAFQVKLSKPNLTDGGLSPSADSIEVVAATGNPLVGTTLDGGVLVIANVFPDTSFAHVNFSGLATGLGPDQGGNIGTATLTLNFPGQTTVNPNPQQLITGQTLVSFPDVLLPAHAANGGTVTLTVLDNASVPASHVWTVTATDVIPPDPVGFLTTSVTDKRKATVSMTWSAPGSDGAAGGPVSSYDLRWSTTVNPTSDAEFFAMTRDQNNLTGAPIGNQQTYSLTKLPPLNPYFIAIRGVDEVGNRGPFSPSPVANPWSQVTLTLPNADGNSTFGWRIESGDFNQDGKFDLAISDPFYFGGAGDPNGGVVYIFNGMADPSKWTFAGAAKLTRPNTNDWFGYDMTVADFDGDGFSDLAVGAPEAAGSQGEVDIYFGSANGIQSGASPDVILTGASGATSEFGRTVKAIGDVSGDTIADLFIGEPGPNIGGNNNQGTGYIFFGGSRAHWTSGRSSSTADVTITGAAHASGTPGDTFGFRWGAVGIPDVNGDGRNDCILPASMTGTVYAFSGAAFTPAPKSLNVSQALYSQAKGAGGNADGLVDAFGVSAVSAPFDSTANPKVGVAIGDAVNSIVYIFNAGPTGLTLLTQLSDTNHFGWSLAQGDLNLDGFPDLLVGNNQVGQGGQAALYLNTGKTPGVFGASPDALLQGANLGVSVNMADYQGLGNQQLDVAVGSQASTAIIMY